MAVGSAAFAQKLNDKLEFEVYDAFALTPEERQLIEDIMKYPYGRYRAGADQADRRVSMKFLM